MYVAVIVLWLHGQPITTGYSEEHFKGVYMENGCAAWIESHVPKLVDAIQARGLPFEVRSSCDALT